MAQIKIHRDGSVETLCGTQDIGGGARTVVQLHTSRFLKYLPLGKITVRIGDSRYGSSGASAGSSTTRGVEWEVKRALKSVLKTLFDEVAPKLETNSADMELLEGGRVRAGKGTFSWEDVCGKLRDTVMSHASTAVDPDSQWAVIDDEGHIQQATEENYHA